MKKWLLFLSMAYTTSPFCQEGSFNVGETFPNYVFRPVLNYSGSELDIHKIKEKFIILNFWGTWCSPCIPEMDTLSKFQNQYASKIQVVAISNDDQEQLKKYLARRPTKIPLASDTPLHLYRHVGFTSVGQSIILGPDKKIIAMVMTDSINSSFMKRLLAGKSIVSSAEIRSNVPVNPMKKDPFGVDSTVESNMCLRSYMPEQPQVNYSHPGNQIGRRQTYLNTCMTVLFKDAFDIIAENQVIYEAPQDKVCNFKVKSSLVCFDFMVRPEQKDSFKLLMQKALNSILPYKGRIEYRIIPVVVLKRSDSELVIQRTESPDSSYSFNGKGFTGKGVGMKTFIDYVSNELRMPVIDETGLAGRYDIKTENVLSTKEEVIKGIGKIGFQMEQAERRMPVLIIY